ncbi:MAG: FecR domain-containing protein [Verrucomicrobiae bacterium]|nr:FecR domain-containing protein [Verrucomicrobiae bacterium]
MKNRVQIQYIFWGLSLLMAFWGTPSVLASAFQSAVITETINEVVVIKSQKPTPAKVSEKISGNDALKTGKKSRASLEFSDKTIARVGANSVFSFKSDTREINLQTGSILFNSPSGKGGGQIRTAAATAAVTGTTIMVVATANGGFKMLVLEGSGKVTMPNGYSTDLKAGQLSFIMPGMTEPPRVIEFNLGDLVKGSGLVNGFEGDLPSAQKIEGEVQRQEQKIASGESQDTGLLLGEANNNGDVEVIDLNTLEALVGNTTTRAFLQGLQNDQFIFDSTLDPDNVFLNPFLELLQALGELDGPTDSFYAFPANNLYIATPTLDLSPYNDVSQFAFVALGDIYFDNSFSITGFDGGEVGFLAGEYLLFPTFTVITFNYGQALHLESSQALYLDQLSVHMNYGKLDISSDSDIYITGGGFYTESLYLNSYGGTLNVDGLNFGANMSQINMDAHTIILQNVTFPLGSIVQLNSSLPNGGSPGFGSAIPGRVNFLNNVHHSDNPGYDLSIPGDWTIFDGLHPGAINLN